MHSEKLIHALSKELSATGVRMERIGIDIVHVQRIRESMQSFGERFAQRMFTDAEAAYARSAPHAQAERLAARFAAKEAAIKALSLSEAGIDWREIEVVRADDGHCTLALHGRVLQAAQALGVGRALVCLSHDGEYAAAVVAALSDNDGIPR
jgi:holo-[acyl-carrier protein] synthase